MKKRLLALLLTVALLFSQAAVSFSATAAGEAEVKSDSYNVIVGDVRVQLLSDTLARVEVKGPKGFEDRETYHVTGRDWEGTDYTVSASGDMQVITTEKYTVYVPTEAKALDGVYMTDKNGRVIWSYTTLPKEPEYLPAPGNTPKAWAIADTPRAVPAEWGYAPLPDGESDNGYNGWDMDNDAPDMYVFVPMNDSKQLRADFIALTGSSEMVPLKALGLWYSCFRPFSEDGKNAPSALDYVDEFRDRNFPLDYFVIDTDWRNGGSHGYDVNTKYFPDLERFFTRMHEEKNVNVVFNDHPEPVEHHQSLAQDELVYRNNMLSDFLAKGLNTWWYDRNWTVSLVSPMEGVAKESFGMYLYHDITQRVNAAKAGPDGLADRALVLSNVNGIDNGNFNFAPDYSSHRYSVHWTGDIGQMSDSLKREIRNSVRSGAISSSPYVAPDVGGHYGSQTNELHARWSQFGAFAPIFRYHSVHSAVDRSPWLYGETAENTAREYINMRYRLAAVYYALAHENYENGLPMLRRLDFNYPQYAESQDDTQYTVGDNILVAPLYEAGSQQILPREWSTADGRQGFKFEYFNNKELSGNPVKTGYEAVINHAWGYGSPEGVNADNFSGRWTGKITLGDEDARLAVKTDDGVRLYVDGKLIIDNWAATNNVINVGNLMLKAGTTHDIKIEYFEGSGEARMELYALVMKKEGDTREVFIPDGKWIDVWTGEAYEGPQTITQSHGLSTSPLFVRAGTILPLVDNVDYMEEKDWSKVTLDVYPSTQLSDTSTLYEDDDKSVDYKDGNFRTTGLSTSYDEKTGEVLVNIGAADGSFAGSDAFDSRTWSLRVHAPAGWGDLTGITLDGKKAEAALTEKTSDASPFAVSGAALDSDVYTLTFDKPLNKATEIRIKFASPKDENIPERNTVPVDYTTKENSIPAEVDLAKLGTYGYMAFDAAGTLHTYEKDENLFAGPAADGDTAPYDQDTKFILDKGLSTYTGLSIYDNMSFDVAVGRNEERISLYVMGSITNGLLEISDGNSAKTIELDFGDNVFKKRIIIDASAETAASLRFKLKKTSGSGNLALLAVAVGDPAAEPDTSVSMTVSIEEAVAGTDISDGTRDWVHLGAGGDTSAVNRKNIADPILSAPVFSGNKMPVYDFPALSFTGGKPTAEVTDSQNAVTCYQGKISFSVPSGSQWQELKLYTGAYQSNNTVKIYDADGNTVTQTFSAADATQRRVITVKFRSAGDSTLYVESSGTGHMFVAAYTLSDIDDSLLRAQAERVEKAVDDIEAQSFTVAADILKTASDALTATSAEVYWAEPARVIPSTPSEEGRITGKLRVEMDGLYIDVAVDITLPRGAAPGTKLGDIDHSGEIDVNDLSALKAMIMSHKADEKWDVMTLAVCDIDRSGDIDVNDLSSLKALVMAQ